VPGLFSSEKLPNIECLIKLLELMIF